MLILVNLMRVTSQMTYGSAGTRCRAVWVVGLGRLNSDTVGSNSA
jgi:hypothetical protein